MIRRLLAAFVIVTGVLLLLGFGSFVRLLLPPLAIAFGVLLFFRARDLYVDFVLWCWFLSPLLRRVVDLQAGWKDPSLILLTPYLVALIAPACDWKRLASRPMSSVAPYIAALLAIAYGALLGMALQPIASVISSVLLWITPILFAWWYASANSVERLHLVRSTFRSFLYGLLLIGSYGILQFVMPPEWDRYWLLQLGTVADVTSMGAPEPYQIRVFSTLNSAGICGFFLAVGLLLIAPLRGWRVNFGIALGFGCLALTQVRSAWLCFLIGLVLLAIQSYKYVLKTLMVVAVTIAVFSPVLLSGRATDLFQGRVSSFKDAGDDASLVERRRGLSQALELIALHPAGLGIGVKESIIANDGSFSLHDNGFAEIFLTLGWLGGAVFLLSLLALVIAPLSRPDVKVAFGSPIHLAAVALLLQLVVGSIFLGPSGFLLWSLLALANPGFASDQPSPALVLAPTPPDAVSVWPMRNGSSSIARTKSHPPQPTLRKI